VPVLALAGDEDPITPFSDAEAIARAAGPRARLRKLAGAGHLASLEQPLAWNRAVLSFILDL
jgi:pimeloyl-ACP methyl ester carboxylesterase